MKIKTRVVSWKMALILLSSMPILHMLATWDWDGKISPINQASRLYSLPVVWLELLILLLATRLGWQPSFHYTKFSPIAKWLLAFLCISVTITTIFNSGSPTTSTLFAIRYLFHLWLLSCLIFLISKDTKFEVETWTGWISWGSAIYLGSRLI